MRRAFILSVLVLLTNRVAVYLYNLIQSPLAGTANAQQLTDTWTGYATSQFFATNSVQGLISLATIVALMAILGFTFFGGRKQNVPYRDTTKESK